MATINVYSSKDWIEDLMFTYERMQTYRVKTKNSETCRGWIFKFSQQKKRGNIIE